ncbi:hypothetical protein RJ640_021000 [Escallonia rubra]|uniref:Uncharacterized protein n=1 Tax=Escallonia rubra TaxID=112253 RepID=A0AA88SF75_9ASTE|nr:hypothetical protein RJ640_021000 [Escallonia rubra]
MELRSCSNLHFIQAIKSGSVLKILNINSRGRPGFVFKNLNDIYEAEDAKCTSRRSTLEWQDRYTNLALDSERVKVESPCQPMSGRKRSKNELKDSEFNCNEGDDEKESDLDELIFGKMTLKQLKQRCKTKRRKSLDSVYLTPKQELTNMQPEEDEFDLKESLSSLKAKLLKNLKSIKKCRRRSISVSSNVSLSIESGEILHHEDSLQSGSDFGAPATVKEEVPGPDCLESPIMNLSSVYTYTGDEHVGISRLESGESNENINSVVENRELISTTEQCESCVLNRVSFDHLEHVESASTPAIGGKTKEVEIQENAVQQLSVLAVSGYRRESLVEMVSPPRCQSSDTYDSFQSSSLLQEISGKFNSDSQVQNFDMAIDSGLCYPTREDDFCMFQADKEDDVQEDVRANVENSALGSPTTDCTTSWNSICYSSPDNSLVSVKEVSQSSQGKEPAASMVANEVRNCLNFDNGLVVVENASPEYDLEHVECASPTAIGGETKEVEIQENAGLPLSVLAVSGHGKESSPEMVSPPRYQSSDMCDSSQSSPLLREVSGIVNSDSGVQISTAADSGLCCLSQEDDFCMFQDDVKEDVPGDDLCLFKDNAEEELPANMDNSSLGSPAIDCMSSWNANYCLSPDNTLVSAEEDFLLSEEKQPVVSMVADAARNCLSSDNHLVAMEVAPPDVSTRNQEKQPKRSMTADAESSSRSLPCDAKSKLSKSKIHLMEPWQPPERLPSRRKAISPTSRERLRLAMDYVESYNDINEYKCREKLCFGKQPEHKTSPDGDGFSTNPDVPGQVIQTEVTISPKQIVKKLKNEKKGSPPRKNCPPKGCFEGPRLSRSLPRLSTGCNSIQGCSESAIAFSQRQMHDIESLAMKLMTELNSMKAIVEEKMLYEGYRNTPLKNDADQVTTSIKNATKVEETARRWLSIMARDCNRFCKIMGLTEKGAADPENANQRERKKISFADEAGGTLCHVKIFEDGMASLECRSGNEEMQSNLLILVEIPFLEQILTVNGAAASTSVIHRKRKRISFADQAGGVLCHVKMFEDGMAFLEHRSDVAS